MAFRSESRAMDATYDPVFTKPGYPAQATRFDSKSATGAGRYKFFQRPMVPQMDAVAPGVMLAPTNHTVVYHKPASFAHELSIFEEVEPRTRDAAVQSKYRESETNTDAYSPEYTLDPSKPAPQILMLAGLSKAAGTLPAGAREVAMLEHAQAKRRLEDSLPPATDEASHFLRRRLLELQEVREFELRQREVDEAHALRLSLLQRALVERDADSEYVAEQRVEALRQTRIDDRDAGLEQIQAQRIKVLRKLSMARGRLRLPVSAPHFASSKGLTGGRDIIAEYATYSSKVYAPVKRDGATVDDATQYDVSRVAPALAHTAGIVAALEGRLPASLMRAEVAQPENVLKGEKRSSATQRQDAQLAADLHKMQLVLDAKRALEAGEAGALALQPVPPGSLAPRGASVSSIQPYRAGRAAADRPATPRCEAWDAAADELDQATRLAQRLLRGRVVQAQMFQGKERRIELIRELRAADAARQRDAEGGAADAQRRAAAAADEDRRARVAAAAFEAMAGETASHLLDFLSKELVRRDEKAAIAQLGARADAERQRREADEAGRRAAEGRPRDVRAAAPLVAAHDVAGAVPGGDGAAALRDAPAPPVEMLAPRTSDALAAEDAESAAPAAAEGVALDSPRLEEAAAAPAFAPSAEEQVLVRHIAEAAPAAPQETLADGTDQPL